MKKNILLSGVNFKSTSGPNSFGVRLVNALEERGWKVETDSKMYKGNIALVFIQPDFPLDPKIKVVQRLDGIWFNPDEFYTKNAFIKWQYSRAQYVVFQSDFDRQMITKWWGQPQEYTVIRNGISISETSSTVKNQFAIETLTGRTVTFNCMHPLFASAADWHGQKRLEANITLFKQFKRVNANAKFIILGDPKFDQNRLLNEEKHNVFCLGRKDHETCLDIYSAVAKSGGWFIHLAWADHCPNTVVEALSRGCPVVCASTGGTKELVGDNGIVIPDGEYNFSLYDYDNPPQIELKSFDVRRLEMCPNVDRDSVSIEKTADKYCEVFEKLSRR